MYGDMAVLRSRASTLRSSAIELRGRATSLIAQSNAMTWTSGAGDMLRSQVSDMARELGRQARALDDAAAALESHASAVDGVKQQIANAEQVVSSIWHQAQALTSHVVEVVTDVAQSAVTGFMNVVGDAVNGVANTVRVAFLSFGGQPVAHAEVVRARTLVCAVPALPPSGSRDWLDVEMATRRAGVR